MLQGFSKRVALAVLAAFILVAGALAPPSASAEFLQQGPKLVGTGAGGSTYQGYSVAISGDGGTALVGVPGAAD